MVGGTRDGARGVRASGGPGKDTVGAEDTVELGAGEDAADGGKGRGRHSRPSPIDEGEDLAGSAGV